MCPAWTTTAASRTCCPTTLWIECMVTRAYRVTSHKNPFAPQDHHSRQSPTVGSWGGAFSYERGTPVMHAPQLPPPGRAPPQPCGLSTRVCPAYACVLCVSLGGSATRVSCVSLGCVPCPLSCHTPPTLDQWAPGKPAQPTCTALQGYLAHTKTHPPRTLQ